MGRLKRNERGNAGLGCLALIAIIVIVAIVFAATGSEDDCYHTPGAQQGSAQDQRDVQHCIEGR